MVDGAFRLEVMEPLLVDGVIVITVILAGILGLRLGFLRGVGGGICAAVAVLLMLLGHAPVSRMFASLTNLHPTVVVLASFAVLALASQFVCTLAIQPSFGPLVQLTARSPLLRRLDAALGILPGATLGLLALSMSLAPLTVALPETRLGPAVREARLAPPLLRADAVLLHRLRVQPLLQPTVEALSLTAPRASGDVARQLAFRVDAGELAPDPAAERQLLALLNDERARAGLGSLAWDDALVPVARAHGTEMFTLGYFAHESPHTGDPFDRIDAARVPYRTAGENLAFAPTVTIAHRGLMASPGHRANILSPAFGRAGIGIVRSPYHGLMVVQLFRD